MDLILKKYGKEKAEEYLVAEEKYFDSAKIAFEYAKDKYKQETGIDYKHSIGFQDTSDDDYLDFFNFKENLKIVDDEYKRLIENADEYREKNIKLHELMNKMWLENKEFDDEIKKNNYLAIPGYLPYSLE